MPCHSPGVNIGGPKEAIWRYLLFAIAPAALSRLYHSIIRAQRSKRPQPELAPGERPVIKLRYFYGIPNARLCESKPQSIRKEQKIKLFRSQCAIFQWFGLQKFDCNNLRLTNPLCTIHR